MLTMRAMNTFADGDLICHEYHLLILLSIAMQLQLAPNMRTGSSPDSLKLVKHAAVAVQNQ